MAPIETILAPLTERCDGTAREEGVEWENNNLSPAMVISTSGITERWTSRHVYRSIVAKLTFFHTFFPLHLARTHCYSHYPNPTIMSSSLVQPLESLSLVERHGNNESKSSASSPPFFLHILDLTQTRVEDLTIELKEEAHNHIRLACTQDMTIGAVKHALACELSQRRQDKEEEVTASTDVGLPLVHTSDMRIIFLTNRVRSKDTRI